MGRRATITALVWLLLVATPSSAGAMLTQKVGGLFPGAIQVTSDPGNPERLLVVDRNGRILQLQNGVTSVLANIEPQVNCCEGEQGLHSIAPAPDFTTSGRIYLDYTGTEQPGGEIHVAEMLAGNPASLRDLLKIPHPETTQKIHYGGQLQLGPEGDLFVSTGDGGPGNDGLYQAQNLNSLLGKILRIEPNPGGLPAYEVPVDNPFVGEPGADEIWSYGLRNPFRFSFDRLSGAMVIGDVGQAAREEVDYAPAPLRGAGANYGWNCREGLIPGPATDPECATATGLVDPVFDYVHDELDKRKAHGCAIIGGFVARDPQLPEVFGRYVYGDFCTGEIRSLDPSAPFATDRPEGISLGGLTSFGEDAAGRLYAVAADSVYRLVASPAAGPTQSRIQARVGIRAVSRPLKRNGRATITVFVSPCVRDKARSVEVALWRGRKKLQRRHLSRVCTASFRPRVPRRTQYRATLIEDPVYFAGESRRLTIKPQRPHRKRK